MDKTQKELLSRLELLADTGIKASITARIDSKTWLYTGIIGAKSAGVFYILVDNTVKIEIDTSLVLELSVLEPIWIKAEDNNG